MFRGFTVTWNVVARNEAVAALAALVVSTAVSACDLAPRILPSVICAAMFPAGSAPSWPSEVPSSATSTAYPGV